MIYLNHTAIEELHNLLIDAEEYGHKTLNDNYNENFMKITKIHAQDIFERVFVSKD